MFRIINFILVAVVVIGEFEYHILKDVKIGSLFMQCVEEDYKLINNNKYINPNIS